MTEVLMPLSVFLGLSLPIVLPLIVLVGFPLATWLVSRWLKIREREVELQAMDVALRLRESRLLPEWVDENDPQSLLAWAQTDAELAGLSARARLTADR
jgi:hypothetical protein